jgi:hypothetical protein
MIVVENGESYIGREAEVVVTQVIQTERGKMIFAEMNTEDTPAQLPRRSPARRH